MRAFKCDFCKKLVEGSPVDLSTYISPWANNQHFDFLIGLKDACKECSKIAISEITNGYYDAEKAMKEIGKRKQK